MRSRATLVSVKFRRSNDDRRASYRTVIGIVFTVSLVVVSIILLGDVVLREAWMVLWQYTPWIALANWVVWGLFYRPCVQVNAQHLVIINPAVIWRLSWSEIQRIEGARLLTVELEDGTRIASWGAPAGPRQRDLATKDARDGTSGSIVSTLNQYRYAAATNIHEPASRRVDWLFAVSGAVILFLCAATFIIR